MRDLKFHEAANIFPLMTGVDCDALKADIQEHGLQLPIEILDGKIIDGRNRYKACLELKVACRPLKVSTDDPIAYVLSRNLHRRHLTASQRAMIAAKAKELYEKEANKRMTAGKGSDGSGGRGHKRNPVVSLPKGLGRARDQAGKAVGVSGSLVDKGAKVLKKAMPELIKAVEEGRMSVSIAANLAEAPEDEQREAAKKAKVSGGHYRNKKPARSMYDNLPNPNYVKTAAFALNCADCAITQLEPIKASNPGREEAFIKVEKWIQKQRKKA